MTEQTDLLRTGDCVCGRRELELLHTYKSRPPGETPYDFGNVIYSRELLGCPVCGHILSAHQMPLGNLYSGRYIDSTYNGGESLEIVYRHIMALPDTSSDNANRVAFVCRVAASISERARENGKKPTVLDIGSGLCVFLARLRDEGWEGTAVDPDPRAVEHARHTVGVTAVCDTFPGKHLAGTFDLITFNKVLEHVRSPSQMLAQAKRQLAPGGLVYVEVPDGETAFSDCPEREEFYVEHWHAFSAISLCVLARSVGFVVQILERLRQPSGKYDLRAVLVPALDRTTDETKEASSR